MTMAEHRTPTAGDDAQRFAPESSREALGAAAHRLGERSGDLLSEALELNDRVPTWVWTTTGLIGGYGLARATGSRPLGGAALLGAGAAAAHTWWHRGGPAQTAGLGAAYILGFGLSHPLAKRIGAWPSVLAVTAATGASAWAVVDRVPARRPGGRRSRG